MGLRGPAPKPTAMRVMEGNRSHRPMPENEPQYRAGVPQRPAGMTAGGRKVWDKLVSEMAPTGVLRLVDGYALAQLCEDMSSLNELRAGFEKMKRDLEKKSKETGKPIAGGALAGLARSIEGRRMMSTIRELATAILVQQREFGLTPASNSRVSANGGNTGGGPMMDALEAKLCG